MRGSPSSPNSYLSQTTAFEVHNLKQHRNRDQPKNKHLEPDPIGHNLLRSTKMKISLVTDDRGYPNTGVGFSSKQHDTEFVPIVLVLTYSSHPVPIQHSILSNTETDISRRTIVLHRILSIIIFGGARVTEILHGLGFGYSERRRCDRLEL